MRPPRRLAAALGAAAAVVFGLATPAAAATPTGTVGPATLASPNGSDFSWTCDVDPGGQTIHVFGRSWYDPANPANPAVDTARQEISGFGPQTLTFARDGVEAQAYGFRCLWSATPTGGVLGRTPTAAYVTTSIDNDPPVAALAVPAAAVAGVELVADATLTTDPDGHPLTYGFDFGDGTTVPASPDAIVEHTYAAAGSYTVTLTVTDPGGLVDTEPAAVDVAEPRRLLVGASSKRPGYGDGIADKAASMRLLDSELAAAAGTVAPVADFWHVYNGGQMPGSWSSSNGAASAANGWHSLTNIKWSAGEIRTDAGRAKFVGFLDSIPDELVVYIVGRHEPENDPEMSDPAARQAWILDQAEFVRLVVDHDPAGEHVIPMSVFMGDPPRPWDLFDFTPYLRPGDLAKMVCGWDAYPRARVASATLPARVDDPQVKYGNVLAWYESRGCTRLGVAESTVNNDAQVPQALVDEWWRDTLPQWLREHPTVELFAAYDADGPAAGTNGYIDSPGELAAVADLMLSGV